MSRIFGGPFDESVKKALQARQDLLNKDYRDDKELVFLNSNHSWIKLTSCVNTGVNNPGDKGDTKLAEDNVLLGGTLYNKTIRQGFRPGQDESSYEINSEFGFIPMPGIDSILVETKNVYGSLKAATVEFKANSPEQLSKLEQLYLRPGFSILLEWGNTHYLDSDTISEVKTVDEKISFGSDIQAVYDEIIKLRQDSKYNYDALFGAIKNFTWAYAQNGEYDCKIDIIGRGELIESLQTILFTGTKTKEEDKEGDRSQVATALQQFLEEIKNHYKDEPFTGEQSKDVVDAIKKEIGDITIHSHFIESSNDIKNNKYHYIPFSTLLAAINVCLMLKHGDDSKTVVKFNTTNNRQPFVSHEEHFILDPSVGFIPSQAAYEFQKRDIGNNDILDIFINVELVINILKEFSEKATTNQTSVLDLVKTIIKKVQISAGNINEFDIHFEDDERSYYIVDRDKTPERNTLTSIELVGKGTTVLDVSLSSKLSSRISSMIAIAARVGNTDAGEQLLAMQKWNEGLGDRFLLDKYIVSKEETDQEKTKRKENLIQFKKDVVKDENTYQENTDDTKKLLAAHISENFSVIKAKKDEIPGLIPIELNITLKGISGLKVGQGFLIDNTILPEKYQDVVGFIITGLSHSFQSNLWQTEITSQMFITP